MIRNAAVKPWRRSLVVVVVALASACRGKAPPAAREDAGIARDARPARDASADPAAVAGAFDARCVGG